MIDGVEFYYDNDFLEWKYPMPKFYECKGLLFRPVWGSRENITKYTAKDDYDLLHEIIPREYKIKNSIHKAYSKVMEKSGNWSNFSFADLSKIVNILSNKYNLDPTKINIRKLEVGVLTLADLINYRKFSVLVDFLHEMFYEITFKRRCDVSTLNVSELELYFSGVNRLYWDNLPKCSSPATSSRRRKQYRAIIKKLDKENPFANPLILELRKKVIKKINQLSVENIN